MHIVNHSLYQRANLPEISLFSMCLNLLAYLENAVILNIDASEEFLWWGFQYIQNWVYIVMLVELQEDAVTVNFGRSNMCFQIKWMSKIKIGRNWLPLAHLYFPGNNIHCFAAVLQLKLIWSLKQPSFMLWNKQGLKSG